jgi:hypothetical protein
MISNMSLEAAEHSDLLRRRISLGIAGLCP